MIIENVFHEERHGQWWIMPELPSPHSIRITNQHSLWTDGQARERRRGGEKEVIQKAGLSQSQTK